MTTHGAAILDLNFHHRSVWRSTYYFANDSHAISKNEYISFMKASIACIEKEAMRFTRLLAPAVTALRSERNFPRKVL